MTYEVEAAPIRDNAAQIAAINRKINRLKDLYINDLITIEVYKKDLEEFSRQIEKLQNEKASDVPAALERLEDLQKQFSGNWRDLYNDLTEEEKRRFWRGILKKITVDQSGVSSIEFLADLSGGK